MVTWPVQPSNTFAAALSSAMAIFCDDMQWALSLGSAPRFWSPAMQEIPLKARTGERKVVRKRQHVQENRLPSNPCYFCGDSGIVDIVIVRARDKLRDPRCSAGELKHRGIFGIDNDVFEIVS